MMQVVFNLAVRTVTHPREVAAELAALSIARTHLWSALALAVVLNTIAYQLMLVMTPQTVVLPWLMQSPLAFALLVGAGLVLSIYALTYVGRGLGGSGSLDTIMTLLVWLQFLRFAVQAIAFVLTPVMPSIAALIVFAASLYGIWLLLNFVDVGHRINNLFTSFGVLAASLLVITLGLAILLSLLGIQNLGLTAYV